VKSDSAVHFLLNGVPHTVEGIAPTTTVLCYLREHLGLMGTKEGCAEGDCGACTVAIAELDAEDGLRLRPVNACIQLLPSLDRKALFTVEGLRDGDRLHPVQKAMLHSHASQCGFCTPGFVMSLFVLMKTNADPDRQQICEALAGNLCRCTGYRPIIEAAARMYEFADGDAAAAATPDDWLTRTGLDAAGSGSWLKQALRDLRQRTSLEIVHESTHFVAPRTIGELADLVARHPTAKLVAGATDAGLLVTKALLSLPFVISVTEVEELQRVEVTGDWVAIGAAVSVTDAFSVLMRDYPHLDDMRRRFSGPGIRAAATLVGNIVNASPVGDWAPILMALGAVALLRHGSDVRELPLEQFFTGYGRTALRSGEFVQAIRVPRARAPFFFRCYKVAKRFDQDIAAVSCGLYCEIDAGRIRTIRIAYGGVDAIPRRAERCESVLQGRAWNEGTLEAACAALQGDFDPISDLRGTRDYRLMVTVNLLRRFYFDSAATTRPMTVWTYGEHVP
jgi:xanthine dehydrogenase small subunit